MTEKHEPNPDALFTVVEKDGIYGIRKDISDCGCWVELPPKGDELQAFLRYCHEAGLAFEVDTEGSLAITHNGWIGDYEALE